MLPKPILLSRSQIDARSWDKHIHHSRQCVIYALSWYLDIVCKDWQALVWPSAADMRIVMPLPVQRKFGQRVLYQPLFCQYLGVFSKDELTAEQCQPFFQALKSHFPYISSYAFNPENFRVLKTLLPDGFEVQVLQTHWLYLQRPYSELYRVYSKDRKANLKKSGRAAWNLVQSCDFEPLIRLFEENHAPGIGRIEKSAYEALKRLGAACIQNACGYLFYAYAGARQCAGVMLARYRGRAIYLFNAADGAGRKGHARAAILDRYFQCNAGREQVFDFESPQKESIARYYAGFGAVATPFYCIRRNALPSPFRQIQAARRWLLFKTRRCLF